MSALYNDFATVFANMTQFARSLSFTLKLRNKLSKFDGEFCSEERMAPASECLLWRKTIKPRGTRIPKLH
jgi:hypothetical protein